VIRDTDFASETAEFTKQQALVQVGASLLATANQSANLVLSLLQ
jgi:flagellin